MSFQVHIKKWYAIHKRDLPWRHTKDPYTIWLSEVILQQTRVDQGMPYFYRILDRFPTVGELAEATEETILKLWQGLGYYSRARNMHETARIIVRDHKGIFPASYDALIRLKGIGPYTAAAISSFCSNEPHAVIDGNVYRVLSRYFGIDTPVNSTAGKKIFTELATDLLHKEDPGEYNQAIMEFGALQCKPSNPDCLSCPLAGSCKAFADKLVDQLPVKIRKLRVTNRFFHYLVIRNEESLYLHKRTQSDIWKNLYDFPLIETAGSADISELIASKEWNELFSGKKFRIRKISDEVKHVLSHQVIYARFYEVETGEPLEANPYFMVAESEVGNYAVPKLIHGYFKNNFII